VILAFDSFPKAIFELDDDRQGASLHLPKRNARPRGDGASYGICRHVDTDERFVSTFVHSCRLGCRGRWSVSGFALLEILSALKKRGDVFSLPLPAFREVVTLAPGRVQFFLGGSDRRLEICVTLALIPLQCSKLTLQRSDFLVELYQPFGPCLVLDADSRRSRIDEIHGLVRKLPTRDVTMRELGSGHNRLIEDPDAMCFFVDAFEST
jgi:hypothetical protein